MCRSCGARHQIDIEYSDWIKYADDIEYSDWIWYVSDYPCVLGNFHVSCKARNYCNVAIFTSPIIKLSGVGGGADSEIIRVCDYLSRVSLTWNGKTAATG